jgi:hypothetical protein
MPTKKTPTAEALEPVYEALEAARTAVIDACDDVMLMLPAGLADLTRAYGAWEIAAEAWNEALESLATQVDDYSADHSERWMASDKGQAFAAWSVALREAQVEVEPQDTLTIAITLSSVGCESAVENASDVLPETPEIPALEWQG